MTDPYLDPILEVSINSLYRGDWGCWKVLVGATVRHPVIVRHPVRIEVLLKVN